MEFIKNWWGQLLIALLIITLLIIGGFSGNKLYNRTVKAEQKILDIQYSLDTLQEAIRQKEFNTKIETIEVVISQKEKETNEIKATIKNPNIDFTDQYIRDSISAEFYYRFPTDGTSIRTIYSLTD